MSQLLWGKFTGMLIPTGQPNQVMQLGHGIPVVRFDDVITGERG